MALDVVGKIIVNKVFALLQLSENDLDMNYLETMLIYDSHKKPSRTISKF